MTGEIYDRMVNMVSIGIEKYHEGNWRDKTVRTKAGMPASTDNEVSNPV